MFVFPALFVMGCLFNCLSVGLFVDLFNLFGSGWLVGCVCLFSERPVVIMFVHLLVCVLANLFVRVRLFRQKPVCLLV